MNIPIPWVLFCLQSSPIQETHIWFCLIESIPSIVCVCKQIFCFLQTNSWYRNKCMVPYLHIPSLILLKVLKIRQMAKECCNQEQMAKESRTKSRNTKKILLLCTFISKNTSASAAKVRAISNSTFNLFRFYKYHS